MSNITYWRMNMHPEDSETKFADTMQCLSKNLIGLGSFPDFKDGPGDGSYETQFSDKMKIGDIVIVMRGHVPVALVEVESECNYSNNPSVFDLWCHYTRKVKILGYHEDIKDQLTKLKGKLIMTRTISAIDTKDGAFDSYITNWLELLGR